MPDDGVPTHVRHTVAHRAGAGNRTPDLGLTMAALYRLSYPGDRHHAINRTEPPTPTPSQSNVTRTPCVDEIVFQKTLLAGPVGLVGSDQGCTSWLAQHAFRVEARGQGG